MPKKTEMEKIKKAIADYIQENGVTSTRDIAEGVCDTIGSQSVLVFGGWANENRIYRMARPLDVQRIIMVFLSPCSP